MRRTTFYVLMLAVLVVVTASCGRKSSPTNEQAATQPAAAPQQAQQPPATEPPAAAPAPAPETAASKAPAQPITPPAAKTAPATPKPAPAAAQAERAAPPPAPKVRTVTLPAGTPIVVRTIDPLSTKTAQTGATFTASLAEPIVSNGVGVAPKGATVRGRVTESDPGGRVSGRARLTVRVVSITGADGRPIPVATNPVTQEAKSTKGRDVKRGAVTTGGGALIGAIAGGGKGAAIGAGIGAATGVGVAIATRGDPAVIPSETVLSFRLRNPVTVTQKLKAQ